jgi:hypothetical protein
MASTGCMANGVSPGQTAMRALSVREMSISGIERFSSAIFQQRLCYTGLDFTGEFK